MSLPRRPTLGTWLARLWTGVRGRVAGLFSHSRGPLSLEKVRTAGSFGAIQFLPFHDGITGETAAMRLEYRRMLRDESVKASLLSLIARVCSLPWQIIPEDETDERQKAAAAYLDWMTDRMEGGKPQIVHEILLGGLIEGHSIGEKVWDFDPIPFGRWRGYYRYRALKSKDVKFAQLTVDQFRNVIAVRGTAWNAGRLYDPSDFVIFTNLPLWDNPQGMSELRAAYRFYWIKDTLWKLRAIYLEKYAAGGLMKGKYKRNELRASLELALSQAKASTYVALPDGTDMDLVDLATRGGNDFDKAIQDCNQAICISITWAFLQSMEGTTNGGAGNSETHSDTTQLPVERLARAVAFVLMHQLFPDVIRLNFGPDVNTPLLTLGAADDADLKPSTEIDKFLLDAGVELSKKALRKRYRREPPSGPDDAVKGGGGQQPGAPPGMPGMGGPPGGSPFGERAGARRFSETVAGPADPTIALPGRDGRQASRLLRKAQAEGTRALAGIAGPAVRRLVSLGPEQALAARQLFTAEEREQLGEQLARVRATANLMGRSRVREQLTETLAATVED